MQKSRKQFCSLRRAFAGLCAALLLAVGMCVPAVPSTAFADEGQDARFGSTWYPWYDDSDPYVDIEFYIAVVKEGVESYPANEDEVKQILTGQYSSGIRFDDAFDASDFQEFGGDLFGEELYDLTGEQLEARILASPSEEAIARVCAQAGIDYDPETQTVVWYVAKSARSLFDNVWHIDGLLVPKDIAPEPEPEPEPEPDTDTEPDSPSPDPEPDPTPDLEPGNDLDSEPGSNMDPEQELLPLPEPESQPATVSESVSNPALANEAAGEPATASARAEEQDAPIAVDESIEDPETPLAAASPMQAATGPLASQSNPADGFAQPVSTAVHVAGAVGLVGVAAGVVVVNIGAAQAGNALSSIDSSLRDRARRRRR